MSGDAGEREQINKNKHLNDESFDFECPNIRITRSHDKQKQIEMNDVQNHITEGSNNVFDEVNLVVDNMIPNYCKENWPEILKKLSDPLKGPEMLKSILLKKAVDHLIRQPTETKINIEIMKTRNDNWKLKCEALESKIKTLTESTKCDGNTRQLSTENQNQMDTTLCKNIGVGEKEDNAGTNKTSIQNQLNKELNKEMH